MALSTLDRRQFLAGSAGLAAAPFIPRIAHSAPGRDPRLLTIVLRGGIDGLAVVAPVGDPDLKRMRGRLAFGDEGSKAGIPLDNFFALNSNMPALAKLYKGGEALFVHAAATPYRARSHFDGQDVLESGFAVPGEIKSGWMNRAIGAVAAGESASARGFAVGAQVPLIMRGETSVLSWMPPGYREADEDTQQRLLDIYRHADPVLANAIAEGLELEDMIGGEKRMRKVMRKSRKMGGPGRVKKYRVIGTAAGRIMSDRDGPRLGAFGIAGWDTHANQRPFEGHLARQLAALDAMIAGLKKELAPVWKDTVIVLISEFGRTVRINGTAGTDHGTATVAMLLGGAVRGGRVIADWPGLSEVDLHEGRDLKPTVDLRAVLKGVLRDHLDVSASALNGSIFPDSASVSAMDNLIA